jgi:hypothetical protein
MSELRWFRLHTNSIDNVKLRMLAFEDRWHYIAICCLKAEGLLDKSDDKNFSRMIAIKLGVQALDLEEVKRRLMDVGLIDDLISASWLVETSILERQFCRKGAETQGWQERNTSETFQ